MLSFSENSVRELTVEFDGQIIGIPEKYHLLVGEGVPADGFGFNALPVEPRHGLLHVIDVECQMTQTAGLRICYPLGRVLYAEDLQLRIADLKIQLPISPLFPVILPHDRQFQLFYIEFS